MQITYDVSVDAIGITLARPRGRPKTQEISPGVYADFDAKSRLVAIEVMGASRIYSRAELAAMPSAVEWVTLAEAERLATKERSPILASSLRLLVRQGDLQGRQVGRTWQVAVHSLMTYLTNRPKRGRKAAAA